MAARGESSSDCGGGPSSGVCGEAEGTTLLAPSPPRAWFLAPRRGGSLARFVARARAFQADAPLVPAPSSAAPVEEGGKGEGQLVPPPTLSDLPSAPAVPTPHPSPLRRAWSSVAAGGAAVSPTPLQTAPAAAAAVTGGAFPAFRVTVYDWYDGEVWARHSALLECQRRLQRQRAAVGDTAAALAPSGGTSTAATAAPSLPPSASAAAAAATAQAAATLEGDAAAYEPDVHYPLLVVLELLQQ